MIKKKARSAILWSSLDVLFQQSLGFVITIVLARLLLPEDFGTIALLALFLGIANLFVDAGFSAALIQKQDATHVDESTVFWFNLGAALLIMCILGIVAPYIAEFFGLAILMPLTLLMAGTVLISALGSVQRTLISKSLDFKVLLKIGVFSRVVSGGVGIYLAWFEYGVWALAGQVVAAAVMESILLWYFRSWRPLFIFSLESFKQLFSFSGYIFAAALLQVIYTRGYALVIGKLFGVRELGFYNRAETTQQLASGLLTGIVSRVTFPLYSSINKDTEQLCRVVRASIRSMVLISAPMMIGLATIADIFIPVVFGDQWNTSIPILQVLCIAGIFLPIHEANVSVLKAQGRADLNFRLNIIKKVTGITLLVTGSFYGVLGVAWGIVGQSLVALMINGYYTKKFLDYSAMNQFRDCMPSIISAITMGLAIYIFRIELELSGGSELILSIVFGGFIYFCVNVMFGLSAFKDAVGFLKRV